MLSQKKKKKKKGKKLLLSSLLVHRRDERSIVAQFGDVSNKPCFTLRALMMWWFV